MSFQQIKKKTQLAVLVDGKSVRDHVSTLVTPIVWSLCLRSAGGSLGGWYEPPACYAFPVKRFVVVLRPLWRPTVELQCVENWVFQIVVNHLIV